MMARLLVVLGPTIAVGISVVLGVGLLVAMAAWRGHTVASRRFAEQVEGSLRDVGYSTNKAASIDMGLGDDGTKLSRQLAGIEPLNAWRLAELPGLTEALAQRILTDAGYSVVSPAERAFILSAATLGRRRMAKVAPSLFPRKQASA